MDVVEGALGPFDEVEAIVIATILDRTVFRECVFLEAGEFDGERVVDDQLHWHHRIHFGRITTHLRDRIAQTGEIDQRGLSENVVTDDARWEPRKIKVVPSRDQLCEIGVQLRRIGAAHQILGMHARRVRQLVPCPGREILHCCAGIEVVQ